MKVICVVNNFECNNEMWTPGEIYEVYTQDKGQISERRCITTNDPKNFFEIGFVKILDISFRSLRDSNLDQLICL